MEKIGIADYQLVGTVYVTDVRKWISSLDGIIGELETCSRSQERRGGGTSTDFALLAAQEMREGLARLLQGNTRNFSGTITTEPKS